MRLSKGLFKSVVLTLLLSCSCGLLANGANKPTGILLLLSYEPLYPAAHTIIETINNSLTLKGDRAYQLHVEYLDADLGASKHYLNSFAQLLESKQKYGVHYDVIIAVGNSALRLVGNEKSGIFKHKPIVFLNSSDVQLINDIRHNADITGVVDTLPVYEFIAFTRHLYPDYKNLHVIVDQIRDRSDRIQQLQQASSALAINLQFHSLAELTWQQLALNLNNLKNEPIVLLSAFRDRNNDEKRLNEAASFFAKEINKPVWHLWQSGVGSGFVGSISNDLIIATQTVVDMTMRIANGASASSIPIIWTPPQLILVDAEMAARHGLLQNQFPNGTQFINQEHTIWQEYGLAVSLIMAILLLFIFLGLIIWFAIQRQRLTKELLNDRDELLTNILDSIQDIIYYKDQSGHYIFCNRKYVRMVGRKPIGLTDYDVFDHDTASFFRKHDKEAIARRSTTISEEWLQHGDKTILLESTKTPIFDRHDNLIGIFGISRDITDLKKAQQNLEHIAHHDALTGLPNRLMLHKNFEFALNLARRNNENMAVIYLDLDRFKDINDTIGHDIGDLLLKDVAQRLHNNIRDSDLCSRLGGDEFVVILTHVDDYDRIHEKCAQLLELIARPYTLNGHLISVFSSAGLSIFPMDGNTVDELIRNADAALHKAKELGRNRYYRYERELTDNLYSRLSLEQDLRSAMEKRQFTLVFQPQFYIGEAKPRRTEALLRWPHPSRGMISPAEFIPLAETNGIMIELGFWVLRNACQQFLFWREQGLILDRISVNVSPIQITANFCDGVKDILANLDFDPHWLELEVTESLMMSGTTEVVQQFEQLRKLGVELAIDDFGTGYSSLSKLKNMPVSVLKIDQSFVRDIDTDSNNYEIANAIIQLAHSLNLEVIAEGVETAEQQVALIELGCKWVQGYYYSKPIYADEFYSLYK